MKTVLHKGADRGHANHGWLDSWHSFSFSSYYDPARMHFGKLRVLNDDHVAPAMGFGKHPHDNMEIVSIPLEGALKHSDSTGRTEIIRKGEVQIMSAGKGIQHSEVNASAHEPVKFLQIWVMPKALNIEPRYEQKEFAPEARMNQLCTVVSPVAADGGVNINQDAYFMLGTYDQSQTVNYTLRDAAHGLYVFVLSGAVTIEETRLETRDALGIWEAPAVDFQIEAGTEFLVIEVPMH